MVGSIAEEDSGQLAGNFMVPALLAATEEVPPPPAPYGYDPDFEANFPSELGCGHPFRLILDNCEDCQVCNTVFAAVKSNRERASFRNNPQTRPNSADRAGSRGLSAGNAVGGRSGPRLDDKGRPISSRTNGPGTGRTYAANRNGDNMCWRERD